MSKQLELVASYILSELQILEKEPKFHNMIKRTIQVKMWDKANTKSFFTGKISKNAIESGERVKEHWYGATRLALDIIQMENPTVEKIVSEIKTKLTWNYTTSQENYILASNNQDYRFISELVDFDKIK